MEEFQHQTPHKVYARSAGNRNNRRLNDFPKITKKCLNAAPRSVSEDSVDLSPITAPPDIMLSKNITNEAGISSTNCFSACDLDSAAANSLGNAQPDVFNSLGDTPQYRKLMVEITEYVMEDLYRNSLQEEDSDRIARELYAKKRMLFLCFCIWIIGLSAVFLFTSHIHCPSSAPSPT